MHEVDPVGVRVRAGAASPLLDEEWLWTCPMRINPTDSRMFQHICTFHLVAEVTKAVLGAVASARKGLTAQRPTLRRGRPSTPAAKQAARTKKRRFVHGGCTTLRHACPAPADALRSLCGKISLAPWRQRHVPGTRG